MTQTTVFIDDDTFCVVCGTWDSRAKNMPDRKWSRKNDRWEAPITLSNAKYLDTEYQKNELCKDTKKKVKALLKADAHREPFPTWFKFKTEPAACQLEALNSRRK